MPGMRVPIRMKKSDVESSTLRHYASEVRAGANRTKNSTAKRDKLETAQRLEQLAERSKTVDDEPFDRK